MKIRMNDEKQTILDTNTIAHSWASKAPHDTIATHYLHAEMITQGTVANVQLQYTSEEAVNRDAKALLKILYAQTDNVLDAAARIKDK